MNTINRRQNIYSVLLQFAFLLGFVPKVKCIFAAHLYVRESFLLFMNLKKLTV